jgi:hypothetical protein
MLFSTGLVIDASGEGTIKTGVSELTAFIRVVAILGGLIWFIIWVLAKVAILSGPTNLCL